MSTSLVFVGHSSSVRKRFVSSSTEVPCGPCQSLTDVTSRSRRHWLYGRCLIVIRSPFAGISRSSKVENLSVASLLANWRSKTIVTLKEHWKVD